MTSTSSWHGAAGRAQLDLTVRKYPLPGSSVLHNSRGQSWAWRYLAVWGKSGVAHLLTHCRRHAVSALQAVQKTCNRWGLCGGGREFDASSCW